MDTGLLLSITCSRYFTDSSLEFRILRRCPDPSLFTSLKLSLSAEATAFEAHACPFGLRPMAYISHCSPLLVRAPLGRGREGGVGRLLLLVHLVRVRVRVRGRVRVRVRVRVRDRARVRARVGVRARVRARARAT